MLIDVAVGPYCCPFEKWEPAMGRVFDQLFAYDTETTEIDDERPDLVPSLVVATACDGKRGVYLTRETVLPFFVAHAGDTIICHNAAFDLKVTQELFGDRLDLYAKVETNHVWDTMILRRLLSLATVGHTARGSSSLAESVQELLGIDLSKDIKDAKGRSVRTGFGRFLGRPFATIPAEHRRYAAADTVATWHLFWALYEQIKVVLRDSTTVWGFVNEIWLREAIQKFGPLTHHVQLRSSILMDALSRTGIALHPDRQSEKRKQVLKIKEDCEARLRAAGMTFSGPGSSTAMQSVLDQLNVDHPEANMKRTTTGKKWSAAKEDLEELAPFDPRLSDYLKFRAAEKLASTYLSKMNRHRLHAKFNYLMATGRTSCSGGFNLQNLPREDDLLKSDLEAILIRSCFVPRYSSTDDGVFIDCDYSQIELVVLAYTLMYQFGYGRTFYDLLNSGKDVHQLIAGLVLHKNPAEVVKAERNSAKPVSFGRPGGMGVRGLRNYAKTGYKQILTPEQVQERIDAYHQLCPELDRYLEDEHDTGQVIADELQLTAAEHHQVVHGCPSNNPEDYRATGWMGGMLLKVLHVEQPRSRSGRLYAHNLIDFLWSRAQQLHDWLEPEWQSQLEQRVSSEELWMAVTNVAGRRPMFTLTGRLRANATFCASRNTVFQGGAADGAILGLWLVWRAGYKPVTFVHDQIVVESPADDDVPQRVQHIEALMKKGMQMVVPGMRVGVETVVTTSLNKCDLDPRYIEKDVVEHDALK